MISGSCDWTSQVSEVDLLISPQGSLPLTPRLKVSESYFLFSSLHAVCSSLGCFFFFFPYGLINQCQSTAALIRKLSGSIIRSKNSQWPAYRLHPPSADRKEIKIDFTHPADACVGMTARLLLLSDILKVLIGSDVTKFD